MRGTTPSIESLTSDMTGDDKYYLKRMKEILEAFPNKGPPFFPVQLCSHLYIGNQRNADDYEDLARLGITHVLNCAGTRRFDLSKSPYPTSSGITGYLMIPAEDHDHYDIMQHFQDAIAFIEKARHVGGKTFVHCNLGVNRSGAICAAYLLVYERKPLLEIIQLLKHKRQFILCNKNFRRQVIRFARCKGLLDTVISAPTDKKKKGRSGEERNGERSYSTNSLDRASYTRTTARDVTNNEYNSLPRHTNSYTNNQQSAASKSFQLESVPERKPISDFVPSHSKYDYQTNGNPTSASAPPTPKTVTFRRPTASDIIKDTSRVRSSPSASPKLGFLSRLGTKITRQRSLTNISRSSSLDEGIENAASKPTPVGPKRSSLKNSKESLCLDDPESLSTTRPLRIYKRSSTDTELYRKPSSLQTYRRAETIASADPEMERPSALKEDPLLPQEYLYHTRTTQARTAALSRARDQHSGVNLLARLKPVSSRAKSRTNVPL